MTFLSIVPSDGSYIQNAANSIPLRVIRTKSVDTKPNLGLTLTDLDNGYTHIFNSGRVGISFKIEILLYPTDTVVLNNNSGGSSTVNVMQLLNSIIFNTIPVMVYTEAVDIPDNDDMYIIKDNPSRKQSYKGSTVWELEFITYTPLSVVKYSNNNAGVLKAISASKTSKNSSSVYGKLAKCNYKNLKYSKKKNVVKCVKYMQKILNKHGLLDKKKITGWFDKDTKKAVKKFQKKYNKKHKTTNIAQTNTGGLFGVSAGTLVTGAVNTTIVNSTSNAKISKQLKVTGKVDKATWKALCDSKSI